MLFDEVRFENQGFEHRIGLVDFDVGNIGHHQFDIRPIGVSIFQKITPRPILETRRFANIKNLPLLITKFVYAGIFRECGDMFF
jgi:hypothetical protein